MTGAGIRQTAATDNANLCSAIWRAHGLGTMRGQGCVACEGAPPRFYPHVVTVDPAVDPDLALAFIAERMRRADEPFFVKDSFRNLALDRLGCEIAFEASWIHRPAGAARGKTRLTWRAIRTADELDVWAQAWGGEASGFFPPALTEAPDIVFLAGREGRAIAAGCIVTTSDAAIGVSNVFGEAAEVYDASAAAFPGRSLVGYERGQGLDLAIAAGFAPVGNLAVWTRSL